jgi:hypothetical protein
MTLAVERLGILPSLEVLPLLGRSFRGKGGRGVLQPESFSSYGEIVRGLLTHQLTAGVIPWEIFVADVLSLPGQRNQWHVPIFLHACPTELVLREPIHRIFHPAKGSARQKMPASLTLGVESRSSLTKHQFREWLKQWPGTSGIKLTCRMLPMELMIQALEAEAIDAIIAPSPWGLQTEAGGIGKMDMGFRPGRFAQKLALVCHRDYFGSHRLAMDAIPAGIAAAREELKESGGFGAAVDYLARCGKPVISLDLMEKAAELHGFAKLDQDIVPDSLALSAELSRLADLAVLPSQVTLGEQTARLLLPA